MTPTGTRARTRRQAIVALLTDAAGPLSIADIADGIGVHPNTIRFHLTALTADGLVERVDGIAEGAGRPPATYRAIRRMDPAGPRHYRALAGLLAALVHDVPDAQNAAIRAGRSWGARTIASTPAADPDSAQPEVERLVATLSEMGFEPHGAGHEEPAIELHHCPFLELAREHQDVICPVHLGLMQGALAELDAPVTVDRLVPFAQPDRCIAHLRSAT